MTYYSFIRLVSSVCAIFAHTLLTSLPVNTHFYPYWDKCVGLLAFDPTEGAFMRPTNCV